MPSIMNQSIGNLESRGTTTSDTQLGRYMLSQKNWPLISPLTSEARNFQLGILLADSPAGMPHMDCGALFLLFFLKINFSFFFLVFFKTVYVVMLIVTAGPYCISMLMKTCLLVHGLLVLRLSSLMTATCAVGHHQVLLSKYQYEQHILL